MKHRHIVAGLIALSLLAVTFIATAAATEYVATYGAYRPLKAGNDFTIVVDTSYAAAADGSSIEYFGNSVDRTSIVVTIFDMKNNPVVVHPTPDRISVSADSVVIRLVKQDGLPSQSSATNVVGNLLAPYAGDTFFASGPGWTYRFH